jgi:hypothetical protein
MPSDISLLPENLRKREEQFKKAVPAPETEESVKMHLPDPEVEDIEIIEIDEGEVGEVLAGEPAFSRAIFGIQSFFQDMTAKLFHPHMAEPPPKLPPQFFTPPKQKEKKPPPGLVPIPGVTPLAKPEVKEAVIAKEAPNVQTASAPQKARVMPAIKTPKRVRIIKRVRKPVRVSFLDEQELQLRVDIPRRRFTLAIYVVAFALLFTGSYLILIWQGERVGANAESVRVDLADVGKSINDKQGAWTAYQDLEPRLKALSGLLDRHVAPTRLFDQLERFTVPDASYSSFNLSPDGHLLLAASTKSYESAARQIVSFRKSGIASSVDAYGYQASFDDATGSIAKVTFQINLTLNPEVLRLVKAKQ